MDGCRGETVEDEPGCEADENGRHRYRDVLRWEDLGMLYVRVQCHECRIVCEARYGPDETLQCRRFYDSGRWLQDGE